MYKKCVCMRSPCAKFGYSGLHFHAFIRKHEERHGIFYNSVESCKVVTHPSFYFIFSLHYSCCSISCCFLAFNLDFGIFLWSFHDFHQCRTSEGSTACPRFYLLRSETRNIKFTKIQTDNVFINRKKIVINVKFNFHQDFWRMTNAPKILYDFWKAKVDIMSDLFEALVFSWLTLSMAFAGRERRLESPIERSQPCTLSCLCYSAGSGVVVLWLCYSSSVS